MIPPAAYTKTYRQVSRSKLSDTLRRLGGHDFQEWEELTVSATETVSFRSLRRSTTSLAILLIDSGGNVSAMADLGFGARYALFSNMHAPGGLITGMSVKGMNMNLR